MKKQICLNLICFLTLCGLAQARIPKPFDFILHTNKAYEKFGAVVYIKIPTKGLMIMTPESILDSLVVSVSAIADLEAYSGAATTLIVQDSFRGGTFNYTNIGGISTDGGTVFPANGKGSGVWMRDISNSIGYNVKWFGAKGDGINDDTQAIQKAEIAVFQAGGGIIFIPKGDFMIKRKPLPDIEPVIYIRSNITLMGAGQGATRIINDPTTPTDTTGWKVGNNIALISIGKKDSSVNNVTIKDFTLIGNSSIINMNKDSISDFLGIEARFQISNLSDTTKLKKLHADNVTIQNVTVLDVLRGIGAGKSLLGGRYADYLSVTDTAIIWNDNWILDNITINGVFNRSIEFSFSKNVTVQNSRLIGAGFLHLLSGVRNAKILNNHIIYGGDTYSNDRQGHKSSDQKQAAGIFLNHSIEDVIISNNIIEASPNISASLGIAGAIYIRSEPTAIKPFLPIRNIKSNNNLYKNEYTTVKGVVSFIPNGYAIKSNDVTFDRDIFVGTIAIAGGGIYGVPTLSLFRNWQFTNSKLDSIVLPRKSLTAGSEDFRFINTTINSTVLVASAATRFTNSTVKGLTIYSYTENPEIDNTSYSALTLNASNATTVFRNVPYLFSTATNANHTIRHANQIITLPVITANRTITPPPSAIYKGQTVIVRNGNTAAFTWSFPAATVYLPNGTAITMLTNNVTYTLVSNGDGTWRAW
jgi:hypothetical protein